MSTFFQSGLGGGSSSSGGGTGIKNLISNGDADSAAVSIFVPYADAASTVPVDGTGGSPSVTTSLSNTSPLDGTQSFIISKPASNVQGNGWSVPFTVDTAYKAKSLKISFDYIVSSGTFIAGNNTSSPALGDCVVYIYDITNSTLIQPSNIKLFSQSSTLSDKFEATFQSSSTGSSYRLIIHVATTGTSAFDLKLDNVAVSPQNNIYGTPNFDFRAYPGTPVIKAVSSDPGYVAGTVNWRYARNGDGIDLSIFVNMSSTLSVGAGIYLFPMPDGISVDSTKVNINTDPNLATHFGSVFHYTGSVKLEGTAWAYNSTNLAIQLGNDTNAFQTVSSTFCAVGGNATYSIEVRRLAAVGWSSSARISDGYDGREISLIATKTTVQSIPNNTSTTITGWATVTTDSVAGFNVTTGEYTVQRAGRYFINARCAYADNNTGDRILDLRRNNVLAVNLANYNTSTISGGGYLNGSGFLDCVVGDVLKLNTTQVSGGALDISASLPEYNRFELFLVNSAQTISESETIVAAARSSGALTFTSGSPLNFDTVELDTHGGIVTGASWRYNILYPGNYLVLAQVEITGSGANSLIYARVNGTNRKILGGQIPNISNGVGGGSAVLVNLIPGDYIDVSPSVTGTGDSDSLSNYISIVRIK